MQQVMIDAALVFRYMNRREVFDAFNAVHLRIRGILKDLDADAGLGGRIKPRNLGAYIAEGKAVSWLAAYDEFIGQFLVRTEIKMGKWLHECKEAYYEKVDGSGGTDAVKEVRKRWVSDYAGGGGVYADGALKLGGIWVGVRGDGMT